MSRASAGTTRFGRTELPPEQQRALRDATRLEWGTLAFLAVTVTLVFLVLGSSQAMRTAWIEDLLSFLPPIAFLVATRVIRRAPTAKHPYGLHRATAVAHLVAAVSLLVTGGYLLVESALWWADAAAAILIAASITWDGIRNLRSAVSGLVDTTARTFDDSEVHPLVEDVDRFLLGQPWVSDVRTRFRDQGHLFHVEAFVVPRHPRLLSVAKLEATRVACSRLDWKLKDLVLIPVDELPEDLLHGVAASGER